MSHNCRRDIYAYDNTYEKKGKTPDSHRASRGGDCGGRSRRDTNIGRHLTEQKLGKSEAAVWENIRISGQNMITVSLSNNPFENEVRYGLIMPDGKLRYVYGSGMCSHAFEVGSTGTYKIYVENVSSSSITVSGDYLYN